MRFCLSLLLAAATLGFAGCRHTPSGYGGNVPAPPSLTQAAPEAEAAPAPVTRSHPHSPEPPTLAADATDPLRGRRLIATETGLASWYGPPYHNHAAADGSIFDQNAMTAAHRTLPMGSWVRVTNLTTGAVVVVRITDRGPFVPNRILDLSLAAAKADGLYGVGVGQVEVEAFARDTPDDGGRWCVQIGAFLTADDSVQLRNDLVRRYGSTAKVIEFAGPTGHWVRIDPRASDRRTAEAILATIHIPDASPYLVRLN